MDLGYSLADQIYGPLSNEQLRVLMYYRIGKEQGYSKCYGKVENLGLALTNEPSAYTVEEAVEATKIYSDACSQYTPSMDSFEPVLRTTSNGAIVITLMILAFVGLLLVRKLTRQTGRS